MAKDFVTPEQYQRGVGKIKNYVDTQHYYEYPTIHYDNKKYPKGYVNVLELKPDIIYKMPKYPEVELGSLGKIALCCKNDDGSLFMINNDGNTLGFSHMMNPMLYIMGKTDSFILIRYKSYEHNYLISVSKNNGIWSISDFTSVTPYPGSKYEYTPTTDYSPATKKYVDDISNTLVKKDTNKYVLITNDDALIIKKDSITDIADATVTIDNLTGQFGTLVANDDGTYSYTLNTIMTDVETFTFKVNNVEQKLVIVPYREMQYDDSNGGITYEGTGWNIEEDKNHYKGKAHRSVVNGDALSFNFKGTGLSILSKCASDTDRIYYRIVGSGGGITVTTTEKTYYQSNIFTKKNISYDTHKFTYKSFLNADKVCNYFDGFIVYDTLGTNLNDSIRKLYYGLDNTIGVLRTDIENARFSPTRLYDPTTKKYVDDLVEKSKTVMCTDEEVDNMLNEVLGGDYSGN